MRDSPWYSAAVRCGAALAGLGPKRPPVAVRYSMAVMFIGLATALRLAIAPQEAGLPYVTYFPAATLAAVLGGVGPAALATLLGAFTAVYLFIPPFDSLKVEPEALLSALVFCLDELVVCAAIEAMRRYYKGYAAVAADLARANARERHARREAELANEAKSRFLAAVSHDLRQPYQALRLSLATLEVGSLAPDRVARVVRNMDVAMTAGETLLHSLLNISTLDAGVVRPKQVDVDVAGMLDRIIAHHGQVAEARGLALRLHNWRGTIRTDPALLGQILDNLLTNALRYTPAGGILLACRPRGGRVAFEVWDTGIGIAPEHLASIFDEFFQVGNSERDSSKGVGLGLAIVRKAAKLLNSEVEVASRPGMGTRFRVSLPVEGAVSSTA